jgi:CheY-like chemotaxis protein
LEEAVLILVVEDEPSVRELLGFELIDNGYSVVEADGAEEAIRLLDKHANARGLVTDVKLGGRTHLTGWDVARHAGEVNPDIAVIYVSGDSGADWAAQGVPKSVMITKPFVMSQVTTALANMLNEVG